MEPIVTLYEREPVPTNSLPPALATLYDGGLVVPEGTDHGRPYMIANFVETLDGIVSYNASGQTGGGAINGGNEQDKMIMGLLRACADAVIFGSGSLLHDANHLHIPSFIFPKLAEQYDAWRVQLKRPQRLPMSVIVTASGRVNWHDPTFHTSGLKTVIATTAKGYDVLSKQEMPPGTDIRVIEPIDDADKAVGGVPPGGVLALLGSKYGVRIALYEGGPTLLASLLRTRLVDELFLTLAPQLAGHAPDVQRLGLVEKYAFLPKDAPWATLLSVKLAGSHLLLRYRLP